MTDNDIVEYILNHKQKYNGKVFPKYIEENIYNYIINRYSDSESFKESVYRIMNNIDIRPTCNCGNKLNFRSINKGFFNHCSNKCASSDPIIVERTKKLKIQRYGTANNYEKIKEGMKKKYGVEHALQNKDSMAKRNKTMIERYGDPYYKDIEKSKQTCLEKYGTEWYLNSDDCKQKTIEKFGVDNYWKTEKCKKEVSEYHKTHKNELNDKRKETYLKRYGVDWLSKNKDFYSHIDKELWLKRQHDTKRKNNTFHVSKKEEESFILLVQKFGYDDVYKQYKEERYPFLCDFYIKSLDLFIECNYHWTHGGRPFNNSEEDTIILNNWKSHNSQYYNIAINVWSVRDPLKRKIAYDNNLNWVEFWNINELKIFLDKYEI